MVSSEAGRAAVTPPPPAAGPRARGSYESSSPGSASRSRSASAFRPRRGHRPTVTSTSGVTREETGRKRKSGWRRREPVQQALSQIGGGGPRENWPLPLKGSLLPPSECWSPIPAGCTAGGRCSCACGLGADFQGSSGCILGLCRDWEIEDSHRATVCFFADKTRERRGATAPILSLLPVARTEDLLYHAEVERRGGRPGLAPTLASLHCPFFPSNLRPPQRQTQLANCPV